MRSLFYALLWAACISMASAGQPAVITDASRLAQAGQGRVTVRHGDTLYSIAWAFHLDYLALAKANGLNAPYALKVGQVLALPAAASGEVSIRPPAPKAHFSDPVHAAPIVDLNAPRQKASRPLPSARAAPPSDVQPVVKYGTGAALPARGAWLWPAAGRLQKRGEAWYAKKGIDIAGREGERIRVAAPGEVVYSGSGLRGYGKLIIVKHNAHYLSAYAFNKRNTVRVGQRVQAGQTIALMGRSASGVPLLHFEIRRDGRSVNPLAYLERQS